MELSVNESESENDFYCRKCNSIFVLFFSFFRVTVMGINGLLLEVQCI